MIAEAPYNPNVMTDYSRKLLESKLRDVGCIEALVWNESTGNLVSGHHRLRIMDKFQKEKGEPNYLVGVTAVHLTPKREKEMNVFLNNSQAQGHFDKDLFLSLLESEPLDLADMGLTRIDLELEFGALPELNLGQSLITSQEQAAAPVVAEAQELAPAKASNAVEKTVSSDTAGDTKTPAETNPPAAAPKRTSAETIAEIREAKKAYKEQTANSPEYDASYYLVLTFHNAQHKEDFLLSRNLPLDVEYLSIEELGLPAPSPSNQVVTVDRSRLSVAREQLDELINV